eukprot:2835525-Rhodomonas_salina.3
MREINWREPCAGTDSEVEGVERIQRGWTAGLRRRTWAGLGTRGVEMKDAGVPVLALALAHSSRSRSLLPLARRASAPARMLTPPSRALHHFGLGGGVD